VQASDDESLGATSVGKRESRIYALEEEVGK
jgi:hypothetical protein